MINDSLIIVTQSYLGFAAPEIWGELAAKRRLLVLVREGETVLPALAQAAQEIRYLPLAAERNVLPVLEYEPLLAAITEETTKAGGGAHVRIVCQDECNLYNVSRCREVLGIPGDRPEVAARFRNKIAMKQALAQAGVNIPKFVALDWTKAAAPEAYYAELAGTLGSRLVLKPTESAGSFGVRIIDDAAKFKAALEDIEAEFRHLEYEIDEFVSGTLVQCDSFVKDGNVVFTNVLEINCHGFEFIGGKPLGVFPLPEGAARNAISAMNDAVITALGFSTGATHMEVFHDKATNRVTFLEIAARVVGGIGIPFHKDNSGVNLIELVLYAALEDGSFESHFNVHHRNDVVYALLPLRLGTIEALLDPDVESYFEIDWKVRPGQKVDPRSLVDNAGFLMLRNSDHEGLRRDFDRLNDYVPVRCRFETADA